MTISAIIRRITGLTVLAGLVAAGGSPALAAGGVPGRHAAPALHATSRIALGTTKNAFRNVFTEAPNGALFYSRGAVISVVNGHSAPHVVLHARGRVVALAVSRSDLFAQTGLTVTEYSRPGGARLRSWTLTSPVKPITQAGLIVVGRTLWSYTDWATDSSGFEFARISRINTTARAVHVVDKQAYPADMAADASGLYFEDARGPSGTNFLVHATPGGTVRARKQTNVNAPVALAGGRVVLLSFHPTGHVFVDTYGRVTLARLSSARVSDTDRDIAGTNAGLLVLNQPCARITCASAAVGVLARSGSVSGRLTVPNAFTLLAGPAAGVIEVAHGEMFLVRIVT